MKKDEELTTRNGTKINIVQMNRASGLRVPQIIVTEEREFKHIPSIKISIEGVSSSESDGDDDRNNERKTTTRLRPNYYRCWHQEIIQLTFVVIN